MIRKCGEKRLSIVISVPFIIPLGRYIEFPFQRGRGTIKRFLIPFSKLDAVVEDPNWQKLLHTCLHPRERVQVLFAPRGKNDGRQILVLLNNRTTVPSAFNQPEKKKAFLFPFFWSPFFNAERHTKQVFKSQPCQIRFFSLEKTWIETKEGQRKSFFSHIILLLWPKSCSKMCFDFFEQQIVLFSPGNMKLSFFIIQRWRRIRGNLCKRIEFRRRCCCCLKEDAE